MRKYSLVIVFALFSLLSFGQTDFPTKYIGIWSGELKIYNKNGKVKMKLPMELHIDSTENDSTWKWQIHYLMAEKGTDIRKYLLKVKDETKGEYVIDEKNGIVLNTKLFGNTLVSRFSIQNNLLLIKYSFGLDSIYVEIITGKENEKQKTGDVKEKKIPAVYNYEFTNYQNAILRKQE